MTRQLRAMGYRAGSMAARTPCLTGFSSTEEPAKEAFPRRGSGEHHESLFTDVRAVLVVFKAHNGLRDLQWNLKDVVNTRVVSAVSTLCVVHFASDRRKGLRQMPVC